MPRSKSIRKHLKAHSLSTGMSKTEIQSWVAASEAPDGDDELTASFRWDSLNEDSSWPSFLGYAQGQLMTSSTKMRIEFLTNRLSPLAARGGTHASSQFDSRLMMFCMNRAPDRAAMGYFPSFDVNIPSLC